MDHTVQLFKKRKDLFLIMCICMCVHVSMCMLVQVLEESEASDLLELEL